MNPRNLSIRDQLLAVLRDADGHLTTTEVCSLAGFALTARQCYPHRHREGGGQTWSLVACYPDDGVDLVAVSLVADQTGYRVLRQLEDAGLVRSLRRRGDRVIRWVGTVRVPDRAIMALEATWEEGAT